MCCLAHFYFLLGSFGSGSVVDSIVAEKYKRKVSMIADLLRDSSDQDMTLKAIKTVIERVGEHE